MNSQWLWKWHTHSECDVDWGVQFYADRNLCRQGDLTAAAGGPILRWSKPDWIIQEGNMVTTNGNEDDQITIGLAQNRVWRQI